MEKEEDDMGVGGHRTSDDQRLLLALHLVSPLIVLRGQDGMTTIEPELASTFLLFSLSSSRWYIFYITYFQS